MNRYYLIMLVRELQVALQQEQDAVKGDTKGVISKAVSDLETLEQNLVKEFGK